MATQKIAAILLALAATLLVVNLALKYVPKGSDGVAPAPVSVVFTPPATEELKGQVAPVTVTLQGSAHAEELAYFYKAVGKAILQNAQSAQQAREIHSIAGQEFYSQNSYVAYNPKLAPVIEGILDKAVGKENIKYEQADRIKAAAVFDAIAWAAFQAKSTSFFSSPAVVTNPEPQKAVTLDPVSFPDILAGNAYACDPVQVDPATGAQYCEDTGLVGVTRAMTHGLIETPMETKIIPGLPQSLPPEAMVDPEAQEELDKAQLANPPPTQDVSPEDPSYLLTHGLLFSDQEYEQFASENVTFGDLGLPTQAGKTSLLYRPLRLLDKTAYESEKQTTGDCFIPADSPFWANNNIPTQDRQTLVDCENGKCQLSSELVGRRVNTLRGLKLASGYFTKNYSGRIVCLRIPGVGRPLFCTEDHRILTVDGWRPAGLLKVGDRVICRGNKIRRLGAAVSYRVTNLLVNCIEVPAAGHFFANDVVVHNCTSHATRNACDTSRAYEILVRGDHEDFVTRGATEPIYGYRGHTGAGMSVYRAAKWVNEVGGYAIRRNYEGIVDLSTYNSNIGIRWGANGPPRALVSEIAPHKAQSSVLVKSIEEARDSICNGYALIVGSGYSFSPTRDRNGFAARTPQGWSHAMAWVATAPMKDLIPGNSSDEPCFLIVNSWGKWNSGPKGKYGDIPDGSFWITPDVAAGMIRQKQAVAVGNFSGFKLKPLKDWGTAYLTIDPVGIYAGKPADPSIYAIVAVNTAVAVIRSARRFDLTIPDTGGGGGGGGGGGTIVMPDGSVVVYDSHTPTDFGPELDIPVPPVTVPNPEPAPSPPEETKSVDLSDPAQARIWEMANPNDIVVGGLPTQRPAPYFASQGTYVLPGVWQEVSPEGNWGLYTKQNGEWKRVPSSNYPELDRKLPLPSRYPLGEKEQLQLQLQEAEDEQNSGGAGNMVEPRGSGPWISSELARFGRWLEDISYFIAG